MKIKIIPERTWRKTQNAFILRISVDGTRWTGLLTMPRRRIAIEISRVWIFKKGHVLAKDQSRDRVTQAAAPRVRGAGPVQTVCIKKVQLGRAISRILGKKQIWETQSYPLSETLSSKSRSTFQWLFYKSQECWCTHNSCQLREGISV